MKLLSFNGKHGKLILLHRYSVIFIGILALGPIPPSLVKIGDSFIVYGLAVNYSGLLRVLSLSTISPVPGNVFISSASMETHGSESLSATSRMVSSWTRHSSRFRRDMWKKERSNFSFTCGCRS